MSATSTLRAQVDIKEIWANIKYTDAEENPYKFVHSETRNIILMGRSRTGKSTVARVMENVFYTSTERSLYAETKKIEFNKLTTRASGGRQFFFNIIDTPGFFDISDNPNESLTNTQVKQFLIDCISKNVCNIHLFAYVFSLSKGIIERDIESMIYTKRYFPHLSANIALIVTGCENNSEAECKKLIEDFFEEPRVKQHNLIDFFKQGVFFMGCLTKESKEQKNIQAVEEEYANVSRMRNTWIEKCISAEQPFNIHRLDTRCILS